MPIVSNDYIQRVVQKIGASVLGIASGGSIEFDSGGVILSSGVPVFSGGFIIGQGSYLGLAGGLTSLQNGASLTVNLTTADKGTFTLTDGTHNLTIGVGRNAPTFSASPGSLYFRSDGSVSNLYWNVSSDGTTGSVWGQGASA